LLKSGPAAYRAAFDTLLARLGKGDDFMIAWEEVQGLLDPQRFDAELATALHAGREFFVLRVNYTPPPAAIESVRRMPPPEVHLLWAAILGNPAEVETALRLAPGSLAALRTRAHLFENAGSLAAAQEELEKARALSSEDPRVLFDLFRIYAKRATYRNAPSILRERAEALVPRLLPVASSAFAQRLLAENLAAWAGGTRRCRSRSGRSRPIPVAGRATEPPPPCSTSEGRLFMPSRRRSSCST
jgi:hypothetical protein